MGSAASSSSHFRRTRSPPLPSAPRAAGLSKLPSSPGLCPQAERIRLLSLPQPEHCLLMPSPVVARNASALA